MKKIVNDRILTIESPDNPLPVIFDSPHSGCDYPEDFNYGCQITELRRIEDAYVDELFAKAPHYNATLICALFPRSYIDVNRAKCDIDETLLEERWPNTTHGEINPSSRSDSGIGLIARLTKPGKPIYKRKLTPDEIQQRIQNYYEPYHKALSETLETAYYNHGRFWHVNCHSMPSTSAYPKKAISLNRRQSDIVLGDRDGKTCDKDFVHLLRNFWREKGLTVTINDPFKGVEIINQYAQPTRGRNSIQIEINRNLYMNEERVRKNDNFETLQNHCTEMIKLCTDYAQTHLTQIAAD